MSKKFDTNQAKINKIGITYDTLSDRSVLALFLKYLEKSEIIILHADTIVLDNDNARKRECCEPIYKKKKAFNLSILPGVCIYINR